VIILDENMLGLRLDQVIARWYPGRVCYITDVRPGTIIKDEAMARLLHQARGATFVTTNVTDFWRQIPAHARYCMVCLALPNEQLRQLPESLTALLACPRVEDQSCPDGEGGAGQQETDTVLGCGTLVSGCGTAGWLAVQSDAPIFGATLCIINTQFGGGAFTAQTLL
jgi:hypothetical protein